jgi:hypothetical protein
MGYLLCGPVGTGKTYMVECLAGDAGVPVVKLKNFRDKWIGSTEGNLEKIFACCKRSGVALYSSTRPTRRSAGATRRREIQGCPDESIP